MTAAVVGGAASVMGAEYPHKYAVVKSDDRITMRSQKNADGARLRIMPYDADHVRRSFADFLRRNRLTPNAIAGAGGAPESTLRQFRDRISNSMTDPTWAKLAAGASKLLGRRVEPGELRGDPGFDPPIPVAGFVGAGDVVHLFPGDSGMPLQYIKGPPGLHDGTAVIVRGESMVPRFNPGDVLIYENQHLSPERAVGEQCVVCTDDGRMYVKRVQTGTAAGLWRLVSVNNTVADIEDVSLLWAARIEFISRQPPETLEP
jgi:hypothetical protein